MTQNIFLYDAHAFSAIDMALLITIAISERVHFSVTVTLVDLRMT